MYPNPQQIQLSKIFTWRGWGYITAANQPKPSWTTPKIPLHSGILIDTYIDPNRLIGIGFDCTTDYLMSDIDRGSPYHPLNNWTRFRDFLRSMRSIGLTGRIVIRSSSSGGIHIYFPLPKHVNSLDLAIAAKVSSIDDGFEVANGKLEFFPNVKSGGGHTRHRLPLQPNSGSCLLDDNGNPSDIPTSEQLGAFIQQWAAAANEQDMRLLSRKMRQLGDKFKSPKNWVKYKLDRRSADDSDGSRGEFNRSLDRLIEIGWTACDTTQMMVTQLLKKVIIFLRLSGEDAVNWIVNTARTMPGYDRYCNHRHDIRRVAASWVRSCEDKKYYLAYCARPDRDGRPLTAKKCGSPNNPNYQRAADQARQRIDAAVAELSQFPTEYPSIESLISAIQDTTKKLFGLQVSRSTLRKHDRLWHPKLRHWITIPVKNGSDSGSSQADGYSDIDLISQNQKSDSETQAGQGLDRHASSILCIGNLDVIRPDSACNPSLIDHTLPNLLVCDSAPVETSDLTSYTKHYNLRPDDDVTQPSDPPPADAVTIEPQPELNLALAAEIADRPTEPIDSPSQSQLTAIALDPTIGSPADLPPAATPRRHQAQPDRGEICPRCEIFTPLLELRRWDMCCYCAQKYRWQRQI